MTEEGEYKYKQFHCRMKYNTYLRLKASYPSLKNESAANYFERLAKYLEKNARVIYVDDSATTL